MSEKNFETIKSYRYMWIFDGNEDLNIKIITGSIEEHNKFIQALKDDERVLKACRVYLHEIDVTKIEMYDNLKEENKDEKKSE